MDVLSSISIALATFCPFLFIQWFFYIYFLKNDFFYSYEKDNEAYSVVMTFFGFILPEYTKHEIRGLNIIVKLRKIINFYNWPRLLKCKDNNRWLKIKYDTISVEEENKSEGTF